MKTRFSPGVEEPSREREGARSSLNKGCRAIRDPGELSSRNATLKSH
jgi:hypothetical protein